MAEVQGSDEQDDAVVDLDGLVGLAEAVLAAEGVPEHAEVSLVLIPTDEMAELNEAHRGKTGPTDVLNQLLIHELGHGMPGGHNHLADEYHEGLCKLGAKLTRLALVKPHLFTWILS